MELEGPISRTIGPKFGTLVTVAPSNCGEWYISKFKFDSLKYSSCKAVNKFFEQQDVFLGINDFSSYVSYGKSLIYVLTYEIRDVERNGRRDDENWHNRSQTRRLNHYSRVAE